MEMDKKENQTNEVGKPLSVLMTEVKQRIATVINDSGLPIYITELILKDIYNDVMQISSQVKDSEFQSYKESQK